jgi:hypothetical protein
LNEKLFQLHTSKTFEKLKNLKKLEILFLETLELENIFKKLEKLCKT